MDPTLSRQCLLVIEMSHCVFSQSHNQVCNIQGVNSCENNSFLILNISDLFYTVIFFFVFKTKKS